MWKVSVSIFDSKHNINVLKENCHFYHLFIIFNIIIFQIHFWNLCCDNWKQDWFRPLIKAVLEITPIKYYWIIQYCHIAHLYLPYILIWRKINILIRTCQLFAFNPITKLPSRRKFFLIHCQGLLKCKNLHGKLSIEAKY